MGKTYKIGEAAGLLNLKSYVLRFWETEFPDIAPLRTEKGQRLYTPEHLALLERIRFLLHERGLTIGGARKILAEEKARGVVYAFGARGAVAGPDPISPTYEEFTADESPEDPAEDDPSATAAPGPPPEGPDATPTSTSAPGQPPAGPNQPDAPARPPLPGSLPDDPDDPVQFNLPGLEHLAAVFASSLLDSDGSEGYCQERDVPESDQERGMLPLFTVAGTGSDSGRATDGGNFIQAGAAGKSGQKPGDRRRALLDIAAALEDVAAMLRG